MERELDKITIEKKKDDILPKLLRAFSDIPKDASGDIFGKIYEYFLGNFALSVGKKGGEFFTPPSVVRFIVEVIEPYAGKIPARSPPPEGRVRDC